MKNVFSILLLVLMALSSSAYVSAQEIETNNPSEIESRLTGILTVPISIYDHEVTVTYGTNNPDVSLKAAALNGGPASIYIRCFAYLNGDTEPTYYIDLNNSSSPQKIKAQSAVDHPYKYNWKFVFIPVQLSTDTRVDIDDRP